MDGERRKASERSHFGKKPPGIGALTLAAVAVSILCSIIGWLGSERLDDRQAAGARRILDSLAAESSELEGRWSSGAVPANLIGAEQDHIDDLSSQEADELNRLSSGQPNG